VNWGKLYHDAMAELHWTPAELGSLTLPQLTCLASKKPPRPGAPPSSD
jgi:hypothetical protein